MSSVCLLLLVSLTVAPLQAIGADALDDSIPTTDRPTPDDAGEQPPSTLDAPQLPTAPIVASCNHLIESETRRIALPDATVELQEVLEIAALGSNLPIVGDWAALDAIGIRPTDRVAMPNQPGSLPVVLDQVLSRLSDAWDRPRLEATADGLIITSTTGAARLSGPMLHPIGDLLTDPALPATVPADEVPESDEALAELIRLMIEPDGWLLAGGRLASIRPTDNGLLVTGPASIQIQVRRLLDQFRIGRPHELEASIELVEIDAETARRLEASAGIGTLAAVRAVQQSTEGPPMLEASVVAAVDGDGAVTGCDTGRLTAEIRLQPAWDTSRSRLRCRIDVDVESPEHGGRRTLAVDQEIAVPVGGLVMPLPRSSGQTPLALLLVVRSR